MSQSLPNALLGFGGIKDSESAHKVIKFVAWYGFISSLLVLLIWFLPFQPLQEALDKNVMSIFGAVIALAISIPCYYFLLKEHFWAPCLLCGLTVLDMVVNYMDTSELPNLFSCISLILFSSAAQATYFLKKQKSNNSGSTDQ